MGWDEVGLEREMNRTLVEHVTNKHATRRGYVGVSKSANERVGE